MEPRADRQRYPQPELMERSTPSSSSVSDEHRSGAVAQEGVGGLIHSTKGCFDMEVLAREARHATGHRSDLQ